MGQIVGGSAKTKRCNLNKLSQLGVPAAGEHILVSSDNSMNAAGQGNFDCYIVGDGTTAATALPLIKINADILRYIPDGEGYVSNPIIDKDNYAIATSGALFSRSGWFVSKPISMKAGDTIYGHASGSGSAWLSCDSSGSTYQVILTATAYSADFSWTAPNDCSVVISSNKDAVYKYSIVSEKVKAAPSDAWELIKPIVRKELSTTLTENRSIIGANTGTLGLNPANNGTSSTDYIDVDGLDVIHVSVYGTTASTNNNGIAFYDSSKTAIERSGLTFYGEAANNSNVRVIKVPTGAKYLRTTILLNDTFECYYYTDASYINNDIAACQQEIDQNAQTIDVLRAQIEDLKVKSMLKDKTSAIMCDWMIPVHWTAMMNSVALMTIVSSTSSSITLSAADASQITDATPLAVGFSDGTYKVVYFEKPVNNVATRCAFDTTDLTNAVTAQNLHDTTTSGKGQHLSASGYLALANFTAQDIVKKTEQIDNNLIAGLMFTLAELHRGYQNTDENNKVYDANGNVICTPIYTNWKWGGHTANGNNVSNARGVMSQTDNYKQQGWYVKCFAFQQGDPNESIEFPISASGKGFIQIECGLHVTDIFTGGVRMDVYADDVLIGSETLGGNVEKYIFENVSIANKFSVKFTTLDQADTYCCIYSINFFEMYSQVPAISIDSSTKIAVLGDSWTQFPTTSQPVIPNNPFNVVVTRPDGTTGDGYGYFPKELARLTGAQVDNWGKSNMTAENWGLVKIDEILAHDSYDYLIIEFFINDRTAGATIEQWKKNIVKIANKCQAAGVRPIIVMPCGTNSDAQAFGAGSLGEWHENVVQGFNT